MIVTNSGQGHHYMQGHGRNNSSDIQNSKRHEEFIKDQKLQAAENAIQDHYAASMFTTNQRGPDEDGMQQMGPLTQSFRNVGVTGVKQHHSQQNQQMLPNQQTHYEKMRNSY